VTDSAKLAPLLVEALGQATTQPAAAIASKSA
jgi:hypothetical protein